MEQQGNLAIEDASNGGAPQPDEPVERDVPEEAQRVATVERGLTRREGIGGLETIRQPETASTAVAARARASIEAAFVMALQRPRDWDQVRQAFLKECQRPTVAEVAFYEKPIGGNKKAVGASIRLAEIAKRCMGNLDFEVVAVYEDNEKRIIRATLIDLETNSRDSRDFTINKTVERRQVREGGEFISSRKNSSGQTVYLVPATEDDLFTKESAIVSKAKRQMIWGAFPGDLREEGEDAAKKVAHDRTAKDPDAERRRILDGLAALNIPATEIPKYLGHDLAIATTAEIEELRRVWTALKTGEATWPEILDAKRAMGADQEKAGQSKTEKLKEKLAKGADKKTETAGAPA